MGAEQSNTSVVFDEAAIQAVPSRDFRGESRHRAHPGSTGPAARMAPLLGTMSLDGGPETALGMLARFADNAAEGVDMAVAST